MKVEEILNENVDTKKLSDAAKKRLREITNMAGDARATGEPDQSLKDILGDAIDGNELGQKPEDKELIDLFYDLPSRKKVKESLSPDELKKKAQEMKQRDQDKIRQRRSFEAPRKRSRLTGKGRGTGAADQSLIQK